MSDTASITDANPTIEEMQASVARFRSLETTSDYPDASIPGCERATWRILGARDAAPLVADGFHLNLVCCEPGRSAPLHNHLTQEFFFALSDCRVNAAWVEQSGRYSPSSPDKLLMRAIACPSPVG